MGSPGKVGSRASRGRECVGQEVGGWGEGGVGFRVGRGRGGMIIIFKLHGLAQENNDVTKSFTYISIFIYFTRTDIYTYTHNFMHTHINVYMMSDTPPHNNHKK